MTKTKKFAKIISVCVIVATLLSCAAIFAFATDNVDKPFTFYFTSYSGITNARRKTDYSSCYMSYTSGSLTYIASALGQHYEEEVSATDCSHGYRYRFTAAHEKRFMYNYALEDGYPWICIGATTVGSGTSSGVWSPDSVYQAGVLPASDYIK